MSARMRMRAKPKKRLNRYNPNKPDWNAVHKPFTLASLPGFVDMKEVLASLLDSTLRR